MTRNLFTATAFFVLSTVVYSQDYFVVGTDTTFCKDLFFGATSQGYLNCLIYTNADGDVINLNGVKNVPDVVTFYKDSVTVDKTPLKAHKPNSYIRYTARSVDGILKVYLSRPTGYAGTMPGEVTYVGIYRFYLKMPDGTYYEINKKNIAKFIKPYLLECSAFSAQYKGDYSSQEEQFMEMIALYNSVCDQN